MADKRALAHQAFDTGEPFKVVAARIKSSPNTVRAWWVEDFGKEAFDARGKRIQAQAAIAFGLSKRGSSHKIREVMEPCEGCGVPIKVNLVQKARSKRISCPSCESKERGVDRECPVCKIGCVGVKGFSMHLAQVDDDAHAKYQVEQEDATWAGQQEGVDFVRCLVCDHRGVRIDRHISSDHSMNTEEYRRKFPEAQVQSDILRALRSESSSLIHRENPRKGHTKKIQCPSCKETRVVSLFFAPKMHESRCPDCVERDDELKWASLVEGQDYVTCLVCGHRAESLVSHIRNAHPELEGEYQKTFPASQIIALGSTIRVKIDKVRQNMAYSAGWKLGHTKETDPFIAIAAKKTSASMREVRAGRFWRSVDLIELDLELLKSFSLKNGKISVGKAMAALGHAFVTIKRECERHGLDVSRKHIQEAMFLECLSKVLGGADYETEWSPEWAVNPVTGWCFRYDGYFSKLNLVVEFHGYQHWTFPNFYLKEESQFLALQERDRIKENLIQNDPALRYFLVREDEPYADPEYLLGRLIDEGILSPGK